MFILKTKSKYKINEYINKSINDWHILSFSHINEKGEQYWLCKCKCGLVKSVRTSHIIREKSKSCTKCKGSKIRGIDSSYWKGGDFISSTIFTTCKLSAKNRNIEFLISIKDLENQFIKQNGLCAYSNIKLTLGKHNRDINFNASIDRINSSVGYIKSNIQWVTKDVNLMKMNLDENKFIKLCGIISLNKGKGGTCGV